MREKNADKRGNQESKNEHAINDEIKAREVRLIGEDGEQLGVKSTYEALRLAEEAGVDLVEVAPNAEPPVCRLLDYGKLKYKEQKKAAAARKRSAVQIVKEYRLRYSTDKHDLETKMRQARKSLEEGNKVRFQMRFRGREVVYRDLGDQIFSQVAAMLDDLGVIEERTPLFGNKMLMTMAPRSSASSTGAPAADK